MSKLNENKVWVSVEDLTSNPEFLAQQQQEFVELPIVGNVEKTAEEMQAGTNRRDFLKYVGFGLGAATIAGCEAPIKKAIPFVVKPDQLVPGVANYYASAFVRGGDFVPVLVKTREGRPIKIEGNPLASMTNGGTSARAQASVLGLYDSNRIQYAAKIADKKAEKISWADLDKAVQALSADTQVRIVSHTCMSPSLLQSIADFKTKFPNTQHIQYDPFSAHGLLEANAAMYKKRLVPNYRFDVAKCIVGIECDFLGTWISPTEYTKDYIKNRKIEDSEKGVTKAAENMSQHIQFESGMSMTGSNADNRVLIKPSEQAAAVIALYNAVANLAGAATLPAKGDSFAWAKAKKGIEATAKSLFANKGKALVVCGINDVNIQMIVNGLNELLSSYGSTILWTNASYQRQGSDAAIVRLIEEMKSGIVGALFVIDANPAFDIAGKAADFAAALASVPVSVSLNESVDETTELCKYAAPDHHSLESWGDVQPKDGHYYLIQPTIRPLYETRQAGLSFLTWAGLATAGEQPYYDYVVNYWKNNVFPKQSKYATFQAFWDNSLHDGLIELSNGAAPAVLVTETTATTTEPAPADAPTTTVSTDLATAANNAKSIAAADIEVTLFETLPIGSGQYANNPWLQETPDPVMRTTWDNFISIPLKWDGDNNFKALADLTDGDLAKITVNGVAYELPVIRQFGQMQGTVSIALGYGRTRAGKAGSNVGKNLFPAVQNFNYFAAGSTPEKVGRDSHFACVQMHHTYGLNPVDESGKIQNAPSGKPFNADEQVLGHRGFQGSLTNRSVFFQSTAKNLEKSLIELKGKRHEYQHLNDLGLYPDHKDLYTMGHHWAMAIDLNSCTGCNACTVACMAENNVPVVGKYEVAISHEMTWLRIDRYYYGAEDTPNTAYMPMMCQHCDNAPCENVCPVAATNHSSEGLNQMTYNRCIGTRYCANNCPYKVRRFNWLDYTSADLFPANEVDLNRGKKDGEYLAYYTDNITRMVLNPDVTVRSRGVIEKCSFCVQRLQEGKLKAKVEGRKLKDNQDIQVACQQACPTGAIVFGDRNDKNSKVWKIMQENRTYIPLEETNVRSSVHYSMKVVNRNEEINGLLVEEKPAAHDAHHS